MRIPIRRSRFLVVPAAVLAAALVVPFVGARPVTTGDGGSALGGAVAAAAVPSAALAPLAVRAAPPAVASPPLPLGPTAARLRRGEAAMPVPIPELTGYIWPLAHARITQPFGPSAGNSVLVGGVETHDGIDLATFCGDRVVAAHDGVVVAAGRDYLGAVGWQGDLAPYRHWLDTHGAWSTLPITVVVDDGDTYRAVYAHFARIVVAAGQVVRAGQLLGYEGRTGHATGCHLHFGLFSPLESADWAARPDLRARYSLPPVETARIDPLAVLPPRLLPGAARGVRLRPRPLGAALAR